MNIDKEIERIVEFQNSMLTVQEKLNEVELKLVIEKIKDDYWNGSYDFAKFKSVNKKQADKVRRTKTYEAFSSEQILCIYLKRVLDKQFHVKYPNRNEFMHSLFDVINALGKMNDYTILRFDFEDFFNTVSSEYVFKKYLSQSSLERCQLSLLENFVGKTKYAYAGLNTSNIICEIIAQRFDELLKLKFSSYGLIFYRRYIDDGILIFNRYVENGVGLKLINEAINETFYDSDIVGVKGCKTRLSITKTKFIALRNLISMHSTDKFDYLGYEFILNPKLDGHKIVTKFKYGITDKKIEKYKKRIEEIVKDYIVDRRDNRVEFLRHKIKAFTFRTVYQFNRNKSLIWKVKGFVANYQELRYRLPLLTDSSKKFLNDSVLDAFHKNGLKLPYFLKSRQEESIYNLYNNLKNYKTLLFVERIGIGKKTLNKMCRQIGIDINGKDYDALVREYLIKVKVGH